MKLKHDDCWLNKINSYHEKDNWPAIMKVNPPYTPVTSTSGQGTGEENLSESSESRKNHFSSQEESLLGWGSSIALSPRKIVAF